MPMDFVGTGQRLKPEDLLEAASKLRTGVSTVRAVVEVEAAGAGFDANSTRKFFLNRISSSDGSVLERSVTKQ